MTSTPKEAALTVKDMTAQDAAEYTCQVSNFVGSDECKAKVNFSG